MKKGIVYTIVLVVMLAWVGTLKAQGRSGLPSDTLAARQARLLKAKLELTTEQQKKVEQIAQRHYQNMAAHRQKAASLDSLQQKEALKKILEQNEEALKEVFSPTQWSRYLEFVAGRRQDMLRHASEKKVKVQELHF